MEMAAANVRSSHHKMKERSDKTSKSHDYRVGDYCYLYVPNLLLPNTSRKLQSTFTGPYIITRFTATNNCYIMRCRDGKQLKRAVNVRRLRSPKVKDKAFLKRLQLSSGTNLLDPEIVVGTRLSRKDRLLLRQPGRGSPQGSRKGRGQARSSKPIKQAEASRATTDTFNSAHRRLSWKRAITP